MGAIDTFTAGKAFGLGVLLSAVNPKNLVLTIGAAGDRAGGSLGRRAGGRDDRLRRAGIDHHPPLVIYFTMGERATDILGGLKSWMGAHNAATMTVLFLVLGVKLLGDGLAGLST